MTILIDGRSFDSLIESTGGPETMSSAQWAAVATARSGVGVRPVRALVTMYATGCDERWMETVADIDGCLRRDGGSTYVICGKRGTGKTVIAAALMMGRVSLGTTCVYRTGLQIAAAFRESFDHNDEVRSLMSPELLVIDESDDAMAGKHRAEFERVIDARYSHERSTLLVMEGDAKRAINVLGGSVLSRVMQTGEVHELTWLPYRKKET